MIYALWTGMVAVLLSGVLNPPKGGLRAPEELLGGVSLEREESWMGIYVNGAKIGFIHSELTPRGGAYVIREVSQMSGALMGAQQEMKVELTVLTDSTLALAAFDGGVESGIYPTRFSGHIEGKVLAVKVTAGGATNERFIPAPEPLYVSQAIKPLLQAGRLGAGDSLKLSGFDPVSMEMQDLVVTGAALKPVRLWGEDYVARELTTRMGGYESRMVVDRDGNLLVEYGPMGMMMRREPAEKAMMLAEGGGRVDFSDMFAVVPKGEIFAPRKTQVVKYRVTGIDARRIADASDRQNLVDEADGVVLVGEEKPVRRGGLPVDSLARFVQDAPFIESRSPKIRAAAEEAMRRGIDRADSLQKLSDWVFRAVRKLPAAGIPSALAVLELRQGDCNEHTALFTAMARSVGIPCRMELGVVYQSGKFYYHAWPAAFVDGRWVEFEPTLGLRGVDAARIALTTGDLTNAAELAGVIGKLGIEILKVSE